MGNLFQDPPWTQKFLQTQVLYYCCLVAKSCPTLCDSMDCSPLGPGPWDSPRKNAGAGCYFLFQETFSTQGSNLSPAWQVDSLPLSHVGSPKSHSPPSIPWIRGSLDSWVQRTTVLLCCTISIYLKNFCVSGPLQFKPIFFQGPTIF